MATTTVTFTSNGSWVVPAGVTSTIFEVWGAGGGGSGAWLSRVSSGGGGGGFARLTIPVIPSTVYIIS